MSFAFSSSHFTNPSSHIARFHFDLCVRTVSSHLCFIRIISTSTMHHHYALTTHRYRNPQPRPLLRLTSRQHRRRNLIGGSRRRGEQLGNAAYSIANDSPSTIRALSKGSPAAQALAHPQLEPQHPQQATAGVTTPVPASAGVALSRRSSFVVGAAQQKHLHLFPEHAHVYVLFCVSRLYAIIPDWCYFLFWIMGIIYMELFVVLQYKFNF